MFEVIRLISFTDTADDAARDAVVAGLRDAVEPHARSVLVRPTLPGGIRGGDLVAKFRFDSESDWRGVENAVDFLLWVPTVDQIDGVTYTGAVRPASVASTPTVYRTLLVAVDLATDPDLVAQFEAETAAMPDYIPSIGASQLSRVRESCGTRWTHVWEQEYASVDGLTGPYMTHPYHWAHVDRWFDPERAHRIVTGLCHSFCAIDGPVLGRDRPVPVAGDQPSA